MKDYIVSLALYIKSHMFWVLILLVYLIAWVNRIVYERKIYLLDMAKLEKDKKFNIAEARHKMFEMGTARYAPNSSDAFIIEVTRTCNEKIERRKLKYKKDLIDSFIKTITQFFGK